MKRNVRTWNRNRRKKRPQRKLNLHVSSKRNNSRRSRSDWKKKRLRWKEKRPSVSQPRSLKLKG